MMQIPNLTENNERNSTYKVRGKVRTARRRTRFVIPKNKIICYTLIQHWKQQNNNSHQQQQQQHHHIAEIHHTMHIPSLIVGSTVTAGGFLLINRELSHRERLSKKWLLRERFEEGVKEMWNDAKKSMPGNDGDADAVSVQFFLIYFVFGI
jgi:hypothetical protein